MFVVFNFKGFQKMFSYVKESFFPVMKFRYPWNIELVRQPSFIVLNVPSEHIIGRKGVHGVGRREERMVLVMTVRLANRNINRSKFIAHATYKITRVRRHRSSTAVFVWFKKNPAYNNRNLISFRPFPL
jgi:hypothetical protein